MKKNPHPPRSYKEHIALEIIRRRPYHADEMPERCGSAKRPRG